MPDVQKYFKYSIKIPVAVKQIITVLAAYFFFFFNCSYEYDKKETCKIQSLLHSLGPGPGLWFTKPFAE